jgi:hypothetical protein
MREPVGAGCSVREVRASDEVVGQAMSTELSAPSQAAARASPRLSRRLRMAIWLAGFAEEEEHDQAHQTPRRWDRSRC